MVGRSAGVTVHAAGAVQAVSGSQHLTQIMGQAPDPLAVIDPAKAARAARAVLEELPADSDLDGLAAAELRAAARDIQAEAARDDPDQSTLRRAAGVIGRNIGAIATSAAGGAAARSITSLLGIG